MANPVQSSPGRPIPWRWVVPIVLAGLGLGAAAIWQQQGPEAQTRRETARLVDQVLVEWRQALPRPFGEGLDVVAVDVAGTQLVVTIRSRKRLARDAVKDPASLAKAQLAERDRLLLLCANPTVASLLGRGMTISRRFVDARGESFFEIPLTSRDCAGVTL